jgi:hypothetical protein
MTTGIVTAHLVQLIAKQVDDKGLVVWYDPERAYDAVAARLNRRTQPWPVTTAVFSSCGEQFFLDSMPTAAPLD